MNLIINGEDREFDSPLTISSLLESLGMKPDRVAVELNRELIPRERWNATQLTDNDKLEIVHFVGGGCHFCLHRPNPHLLLKPLAEN
jgi:thiamine biosynthesis protein ThiS